MPNDYWERPTACSRFVDDFGEEWYPYTFSYDLYMARYYLKQGAMPCA